MRCGMERTICELETTLGRCGVFTSQKMVTLGLRQCPDKLILYWMY